MTKLAKRIDREIGPLIYDLNEGETNPAGITDSANDIKRDLGLIFNGLYREVVILERLAGPLARKALTTANKQHRADFIRSFKEGAGVDLGRIINPSARVGIRPKIGEELVKRDLLIDKGVNATFEEAIHQNVDLIKTIPRQYLDQVESAIYTGLRAGVAGHSLKQLVMKVNGQNYNRARLIARDQLQKFNAALSQSRQQSIGVEGYIWRTSGDDRTRDTHRDNDGIRFDWNAPSAETGHPGEDIQCRCTAEPDLSNIAPWGPGIIKKEDKKKKKARKKPARKAEISARKPRTLKGKIRQVEGEIVKNRFETGVLFDSTGEIYRKKGTRSQVKFNFAETLQMRGKTLTHNHPNNSPFSADDMAFLLTSGLREIRAVGEKQVFVMINDKKVSYKLADRLKSHVNSMYKQARREAKDWARMQERKGIDVSNELLNNVYFGIAHEEFYGIARLYGLKYRKEKRNAKK